MDDLVAFLRARLDEDAEAAREAADGDSGDWFVGDKWNVYRAEDEAPHGDVEENRLVVYGNVLVQSAHIARHDPARVLREVEAKRELLDEHGDVNDGSCGTCVDGQWGYPTHGGSIPQNYPCKTLRLLALPYADHPDYRPEWAPAA